VPTGGFPSPFATSIFAERNPTGPLPIAAHVTFPASTFSVQFDRPLQPGALAFLTWTFRVANNAYQATTATAAADTVSGTVAPSAPPPPPGIDAVWYSAVPADVIGLDGAPADPIIEFPVT
jgi:hypothetical protein